MVTRRTVDHNARRRRRHLRGNSEGDGLAHAAARLRLQLTEARLHLGEGNRFRRQRRNALLLRSRRTGAQRARVNDDAAVWRHPEHDVAVFGAVDFAAAGGHCGAQHMHFRVAFEAHQRDAAPGAAVEHETHRTVRRGVASSAGGGLVKTLHRRRCRLLLSLGQPGR